MRNQTDKLTDRRTNGLTMDGWTNKCAENQILELSRFYQAEKNETSHTVVESI